MAKNDPNDPIFGPVVYFIGFYQIPKKIENLNKITDEHGRKEFWNAQDMKMGSFDLTDEENAAVEEYMDKHEDLKEFEKELQKHKDKITPGTIGES